MERYESLGPLGEGSYGTVVKCRHRDSGRLVAIKKFLDSDDDRMVKKIALREIKLLRQLRHENLVSLLEAWKRRRRWYLVFEFVERTLLDHLEQNPGGLDLDTSRRYLFQILRACAFCHQHNIMHRDIKPENILISMGGVVKLCDFGFARTVASPAAAYTDYVATRWYRAPELLVGDTKYGKPVDVWAIGCLLIETLTGQPLFPGDSDLDQIHHIVRCFGNLTLHHQELFRQNPVFSGVRPPECSTPVSLQQRFHMMSPSALDLAQNCLEVNPEKRAQCWELLDHLLFTQDAFHIRFVGELNATIQNDHRENSTLPKINKILRPECNKGDERKRRAKEKQPEDFNVKVNKDKTKRKNNPKPSRPPGNAVEHLTKQSKSIRNTIPGKCHGASKNKLGKGTGTENSRSYKPPTCNSLDLSEKTNERMDHWCKVRKDGESIVCRPAEERLMENSRSSNLEQNLEFGRRRSNTTASRVSGRCRCLSSPLESNSRPTKESTQVSNICPVEETKRTSEHQTRVDWRDPNSLEAIPSNPKLSTTPKPNQSSSSSPMAPQVHFSAQSCTVLTDPKMPPQRSNLIPKTLTKVKKVTPNIGDNQACRSLTSTIGAENCPKRSVLGKDQKEDLKWKVPTQITSLCMPCENTAEGTGLLKTRNISDKENHVDPASAVSRRTQSKRSVHGVFSGTWRDEKHVSHGHLELVVKSLNPVSLQSMVMTKTSRAALANTMTDDVKDLTSIVSAQGQDSSPQDTVHNSLSGADLMEGLRSSIPHVSSPTPLLSPAIACSSEVGGHLTLVTVFHSGTPEIRSVHQNAGHRSANPAQQNQDFLSGHVSGLLPYQRERVPDPSDFRVGGSSVTAARKGEKMAKRVLPQLDSSRVSCSICLDLLKDPVTVLCGHSYCWICVNQHWDKENQQGTYSCPQCRKRFRPRPQLEKNIILAELVEDLKKTQLQAPLERTKKEVEASRMDIQQRIEERRKDMKLLQQQVVAIKVSTDGAVEHSQENFTVTIRLMEKMSREVRQWLRSQQKTAVSEVREHQEKLERDIVQLKKKDAQLERLAHTEDYNRFLHGFSSVAALMKPTPSSTISIAPLSYLDRVAAALSVTRKKVQDILTETNLSLRSAGDQLLLPAGQLSSREDFLLYFQQIILDPNTAHRQLIVSNRGRKVTVTWEEQCSPDHPDRFTRFPQVLSREGLTGRQYWEVEWRGGAIQVAVAYKNISRSGSLAEGLFGFNDKSWSFRCQSNRCTFCHNGTVTTVSSPRRSRFGVYLDHTAGLLSFYGVSETMTLLHRVQTTFTQPLLAGVWLYGPEGAWAELVDLGAEPPSGSHPPCFLS